MRFFKPTGVAALILSLASAAHAGAPPPTDAKRAAQSFAVGKTAFARGDFAAAAAAFEQAANYAPHPAPLVNAAEAWALAGNYVRAAQICDRVLAMSPLEPKFRDGAEQQLARATSHIGTIEVRVPDGTRILVDGARDEAFGDTLRLASGAHALALTYPSGETRNEKVSVAAGESKTLDLMNPVIAPPPAPATPPPPPVETSSGPPLGSWIAFGVAAGTAGAATYFGVSTINAKTRYDAAPIPTTTQRDTFNSNRLLTDVFIGAVVVSAAVGVVLWIAKPSATSSDAPSPVTDAMSGTFRF